MYKLNYFMIKFVLFYTPIKNTRQNNQNLLNCTYVQQAQQKMWRRKKKKRPGPRQVNRIHVYRPYHKKTTSGLGLKNECINRECCTVHQTRWVIFCTQTIQGHNLHNHTSDTFFYIYWVDQLHKTTNLKQFVWKIEVPQFPEFKAWKIPEFQDLGKTEFLELQSL